MRPHRQEGKLDERIKRVFRTAQTFFPWLADAKPVIWNGPARLLGRPFEADFEALRLIGGAGQLCLDVGANRGQSIEAIRLTATSPHIVSFEPNPLLAGRLIRRFGGLPQVRVRPVGLGDRAETFDLHIPTYRGYRFDGLASFDRDAAMSWLNPRTIVRFDPAKLRCETVRCRIETLDSFRLAPFFIKLDVQGYEYRALVGGRDTLRRHTPILLVESAETDVVGYLREFGYRPYRYDRNRRRFEPGFGSPNTFFMTEAKIRLAARRL